LDLLRGELTGNVIGAAIEVHRVLGPGLLESAYAACLEVEFRERGLSFAREVLLPVQYKDARVDAAYRMDFVVDGAVIVELKCVKAFTDIHRAQLLTYLRISRHRVGLLFNFNSVVLTQSMIRLVL
jgi:GxxExxY protein